VAVAVAVAVGDDRGVEVLVDHLPRQVVGVGDNAVEVLVVVVVVKVVILGEVVVDIARWK
jgi:hypothetical protein